MKHQLHVVIMTVTVTELAVSGEAQYSYCRVRSSQNPYVVGDLLGPILNMGEPLTGVLKVASGHVSSKACGPCAEVTISLVPPCSSFVVLRNSFACTGRALCLHRARRTLAGTQPGLHSRDADEGRGCVPQLP